MEDVDHELSTIQGVKEDVTDIILNLKQVNIRFIGEQDTRIRLKSNGEGVLKASDIEAGSEIEILNPEQHVCTVGEDGKVDMEMIVRHGRGYVSADDNKTDDIPSGFIVMDSVFAPVRRVAYSITNARVGQMTDYDKLTIEIWTNGAVRPDDSLAYAAKILKEQLTIFINFDETEEVEKRPVEDEEVNKPQLNENLFKTVDSLELSVRAANCLENANIKFIGELVTRTEADMLKTKNFGRKSLNEIKDILAEMGLSLGMKIDGFDPSMLRQKDSDN
jgi:DNA-directed RNA polymerase subunit alpha